MTPLIALLLAQIAGLPGQIQTPNAGRWVSTQGTYQCTGTGCVSRSIASKLGDLSSAQDFGAVADGVADDTVAINACLAATHNCYLPKGIYKITDSLNLTNYGGGTQLFSNTSGTATTILWAGANTKPVIDATGSFYVNISDIWISAPVATPAQTGILFSRMGSQSSQAHTVSNVFLVGYFTVAAIYEFTSEGNGFYNVFIQNDNVGANSYGYIHTDTVEFGVASRYQTMSCGVNCASNTLGTWNGGQIIVDGGSSTAAVHLRNVSEMSFYATYMNNNNAAGSVVEITGPGTGAVTASDVLFSGVRQEGSAAYGIRLATADIFQRVHVESTGISGATAAISGVTGAQLTRWWVETSSPLNSTYLMNVDLLYDSRIDMVARRVTVVTTQKGNTFFNDCFGGSCPADSLSVPAGGVGYSLIGASSGGGGNTHGARFWGDGTGAGVVGNGGGTSGPGGIFVGNTTNGDGVQGTGSGSGSGGVFTAGGSGGFGINLSGASPLFHGTTTFAALGTPGSRTQIYCSDCVIAPTCAGSGSGALATRINGAWNCNGGGASNSGTITLSSGTPSTGTATVLSGAKCVCTNQTTQANPIKCAVATTTLTATGPNTVTDVVTYLCF